MSKKFKVTTTPAGVDHPDGADWIRKLVITNRAGSRWVSINSWDCEALGECDIPENLEYRLNNGTANLDPNAWVQTHRKGIAI